MIFCFFLPVVAVSLSVLSDYERHLNDATYNLYEKEAVHRGRIKRYKCIAEYVDVPTEKTIIHSSSTYNVAPPPPKRPSTVDAVNIGELELVKEKANTVSVKSKKQNLYKRNAELFRSFREGLVQIQKHNNNYNGMATLNRSKKKRKNQLIELNVKRLQSSFPIGPSTSTNSQLKSMPHPWYSTSMAPSYSPKLLNKFLQDRKSTAEYNYNDELLRILLEKMDRGAIRRKQVSPPASFLSNGPFLSISGENTTNEREVLLRFGNKLA